MARGPMSSRVVNGDGDEDNDHQGEQVDSGRRREGSIVKVIMKDFITYDSVECNPGDSLNVVIGPNGTGKSTILSAIVLGLGGKPVHLGKPNAPIQDFIKNHRQEAQITIELFRHRKNTIIKRTILKDGKSIWHLNGRQVNMKDIEAETKSMNIQIDNLCQVLAQDRVQDFAKLNKQELLEATQKAVGKEGMSQVHSKLKDLQRLQKQLETQIASAKKQHDVEQGHVARLQGEVDKIEKREGIEAEAAACQMKLQCIIYKAKKDEVVTYKALKREAEAKQKGIEDQIRPIKQQIREAEAKANAIHNRKQGMGRRIENQVKAVKDLRNGLENFRDEILEMELDQEKQLKYVEMQKHQEDALHQAISKLRNDIAALQSMSADDVQSQEKQYQTEINILAQNISRKENSKNNLGTTIDDLGDNLRVINHKISRLDNQKGQRMRKLQELHNHAYQAAKWVDENRNKFTKPVFLPMIVELDVDPNFARYAENAIGFNDMIAIVCESKDDMKIIIDNCRLRMNLTVNVLQADGNTAPCAPQTSPEALRSKFPQFNGYLSDFVKGPNTLLSFLCHRKNFHKIPVALGEVEASDHFSLYYSGDYRKGYSKSQYRSDLMYLSDWINPARCFVSTGENDNGELLKAEAKQVMRKIESKTGEKRAIEEEISDMNKRRSEARDKLHKLQQKSANLKQMTFQLNQKEKDLVGLERNRADPDKVKQDFMAKVRVTVLKLAETQESFFQSLKLLDACIVDSSVIEFELKAAKAVVAKIKQLHGAEGEALENAKRECEAITNTLSGLNTEAKSLADAIKNQYGDRRKDVTQVWNENSDLFSTLPNSIDELETNIEEKTARAQLLGGGNDAETVQQFKAHVAQLVGLERTITQKEGEVANLVVDMETRENQWKTELNELVQTIANNFSRYFSEMRCAGTVELYTGNNEHDYDNYGLRVRVKFRDNEELQDLNAHTQSGGERAVSTAIYMLSLQELTPAPFRLVDEINQGMDSINERRVYELLLRSTSRTGTPQYFLLTPKLLSDMKYNPGTTVLCVMNSACAPSHKQWDLKKFVEIRKKQGPGNGGPYDSENGAMEIDD